MKFTGNPNIDKHIKRGLGPMDKVNMDDYWAPHIPFLEYITEVGSEDDIKTMLEDNFGIDNLLDLETEMTSESTSYLLNTGMLMTNLHRVIIP